MTKDELLKKLKEIDGTYSQEERVKLLEEISNMLKDANQELKDLYTKTKIEISLANSSR